MFNATTLMPTSSVTTSTMRSPLFVPSELELLCPSFSMTSAELSQFQSEKALSKTVQENTQTKYNSKRLITRNAAKQNYPGSVTSYNTGTGTRRNKMVLYHNAHKPTQAKGLAPAGLLLLLVWHAPLGVHSEKNADISLQSGRF